MGLNPFVQMAFGCAPHCIRLAAFLSAASRSLDSCQLRTSARESAVSTAAQSSIQHTCRPESRLLLLLQSSLLQRALRRSRHRYPRVLHPRVPEPAYSSDKPYSKAFHRPDRSSSLQRHRNHRESHLRTGPTSTRSRRFGPIAANGSFIVSIQRQRVLQDESQDSTTSLVRSPTTDRHPRCSRTTFGRRWWGEQ